ncbi:MAG: DNA polymerase III subunit beta [Bacteroidales bacterium]|nr:DNA polymerase III subunit beta [Bacteroidales bacterium]MBN2762183.1 DNA polymerase III subunit beta [Bacteroidales bacterium]
MKFVVSSIDLLNHLQSASRVISPKNTLPILDNYLFKLDGNRLEITASDLETTMITTMELENVSDKGSIAIPARLLTDSLKEFPDQPLAFDINTETCAIVISSENGQFSVVGQNGDDFPQLPQIKQERRIAFRADAEALASGINNTLFATADDELRPVMNGIYFELTDKELTFVASDAHKLVRYRRSDIKADDTGASFILPKKPASILKNILTKEQNQLTVEFDDKNAFFTFSDYKLVCRLVEGNYPSYNSVIPTNNNNKLIIDRSRLLNTIKRVSVFSNQASNLVRLKLKGNKLTVSAQDIDFSTSAYEDIACQYNGDDIEIGFKSTFLVEILNNLESSDVSIELSDASRAGLLLPFQQENENEDILMLLMPMMIGA